MTMPTGTPALRSARERLQLLDDRTVHELEAAALEVTRVIEAQAAAMEQPVGVPTDLAQLRVDRRTARERCLDAPIAALDRAGPDRLALAALDMHVRTVDGWVRMLPSELSLSGREAVELADEWGARSAWRWVARWRRPQPLPLRAIAAGVVDRLGRERARVEAEYAAALADALRQVSRQWVAARIALDAAAGRELDDQAAQRALESARSQWSAVARRLDETLAERRRWLTERFLPALGAAVVRGLVRPVVPAGARLRRLDWLERSRRRCESVRAELSLQQGLQDREAGLLESVERELERALDEERGLHAELLRILERLRSDAGPGEVKVAIASTPAAARVGAIARAVERETAVLPERVTLVPRLRGRSARGGEGRTVRPAAVFEASCRETLLPSATELFRVIERDQREIADDLRRACDVVAFALRAAGSGEAASRVLQEAVANAVTLLEFRRDSPPGRRADGMRTGAAVCRACRHAYVDLYGDSLEQISQELRGHVERGFPVATAALGRWLRRAATVLATAVRGGTRRSLSRIGWLREPSAGEVTVRVRPVLPAEFAGDVARESLPALYKHLFRPQPVEDPRFLVGRQPELAAVRDARVRWEAGRSAGIVVTGERGSGKTSLVNCALLGPLEGLPIDRGEFRERVLDEASLRTAIARVVGADDPAALEEQLAGGRRVVVLEELERTFLRHIGRYEAVRALGRLLNATSGTVLWIVVVNEVAFRFLDRAIGLGHQFSHRINAGTATAAQIRDAILVRHNLSGLRLRFEPPVAAAGIQRWLRRRGSRRVDPERAFFDMTVRQSGGVYRTAFNIWLGHIGGISDGLCTIRAPATSDLAPLIEDLSLDDLFTLVALLQHGSLTPAEHAVVFQQPAEVSRAQIDELVAREIVAPDPGRPGYRVRPEAMSVAKEALFRRNLL